MKETFKIEDFGGKFVCENCGKINEGPTFVKKRGPLFASKKVFWICDFCGNKIKIGREEEITLFWQEGD